VMATDAHVISHRRSSFPAATSAASRYTEPSMTWRCWGRHPSI
jgi:hypothetical protein